MTPEMAFECLLLSHDPATYATLSALLRDFSICVEHCLTASEAMRRLSKGSHDLIVIDWEGDTSSAFVHEIRKSPLMQRLTIMAICAENCSLPGVHVAIRRPVTPAKAAAPLRSAYYRMLRDHRLHARYAIMTRLTATDKNSRKIPVTITDIGYGGLGIKSGETLVVGDVLSFVVLLPGSMKQIHIEARVLWNREYGVAGCGFLRIPPVDLDMLHGWLDNKTRVKPPLVSL